jgi:hypothetical protein
MMRKVLPVIFVFLMSLGAFAASVSTSKVQAFPGTLANAKYVYVTSYDGNDLNWNVLPQDRQAIADVQNAIQKWGRYIIVYNPRQADMIIAVQRRGEDVLAVYDPRLSHSTYLWRAMSHDGLQPTEMPLFGELRQAVEGTK